MLHRQLIVSAEETVVEPIFVFITLHPGLRCLPGAATSCSVHAEKGNFFVVELPTEIPDVGLLTEAQLPSSGGVRQLSSVHRVAREIL